MICLQYSFVTVHEQNDLKQFDQVYTYVSSCWSMELYHWISRIIGAIACTLTNSPGIFGKHWTDYRQNTFLMYYVLLNHGWSFSGHVNVMAYRTRPDIPASCVWVPVGMSRHWTVTMSTPFVREVCNFYCYQKSMYHFRVNCGALFYRVWKSLYFFAAFPKIRKRRC
jgi:hypothetical protein